MAESLRDSEGIHQRIINNCKVCGCVTTLKLCARCKQVAYCSKEHQKQDWSDHKVLCKTFSNGVNSVAKTSDNPDTAALMGVVSHHLKTLSIDSDEAVANVTSDTSRVMNQPNSINKNTKPELLTNSTSTIHEEDNAVLKLKESTTSINNCHKTDVAHTHCNSKQYKHKKHLAGTTTSDLKDRISNSSSSTSTINEEKVDVVNIEAGSSERFILESEDSQLHAPDYTKESGIPPGSQPNLEASMPYISVVQSRNKALSDYVIKCLNSYGLCVIDNFLGDSKGTDILDEVTDLYDQGALSSGELVNTAAPKVPVRGDVITWVEGTELGCSNISFLISSIDAIMLHCQRSLGQYHVKGRSKAMVAAYPSSSTGFLRHVDNPSGDGRCVTCIYYLNKNWNSKTDGGLLRIFPEGTNRVANVEPKFDRLLFFWSDRRNPHEVLPACKTRFAVTVWYYDEQERRRAVKKFKGSGRSMDMKHKQVFPIHSSD